MARLKFALTIVGAGFFLGGCSTLEEIFPSLTGYEPSGYAQPIPASPSESIGTPTVAPVQTVAMQSTLSPAPIVTPLYDMTGSASMGQPTGTFVGEKVGGHQQELSELKAAIGQRNAQFQQQRTTARQDSQTYYATIAAINARLQIGTTPGNPILVSQWNAAQSELDRILADIAALNALGNQVAADSAMAAYLLESVRAAYGLQGAIDEDHRQLATLEDEVNRSVVLIDRQLNEINETINRYTAYVNSERRNLTTISVAIKNGEYYGTSLMNRAFETGYTTPASMAPAPAMGPSAAAETREPLVIIRFDRPDVDFEQALYTAVARALERRPSSSFDLLAVSPNQGTPAEVALNTNNTKRNAQRVLTSLTEMGLPSNRVNLSSLTSPDAYTSEVHIYVR
jgi:hypothetical protein